MLLSIDLLLFVISVFFSLLIGASAVAYFFIRRKKIKAKEQTVILLEKVRRVCKLITVEGEFSEIHDHIENKVLFSMIPAQKKALLVVKAKAMVGFDLSKIQIDCNSQKKTLTISEFPDPEIMSVESDIRFYDIKHHMFNKFSSDDFTKLNAVVVKKIKDKIKEGTLPEMARAQALETLQLIDTITDAMGWNMIYNGKKLTNINDPKKLK